MGDRNTRRTVDPRHIQGDQPPTPASVQQPEEEAASSQQIQASKEPDYVCPSEVITHPTSDKMPSEGAKKKKSVTFPEDELIVTDYYEPLVYFNQNDDAPDQDIVDLYKAMCEKLNVSPSEVLISQMRNIDPEEPTLDICELLEAPAMEALEPAFRKAQFTKVIISAEQDEDGMRALIEILEFFQTTRVMQITIGSGVSEPVWGVFCTHLRKAHHVEELDLGGTPMTDPELMFFSKVLRRVSNLTVLRMPRCGLTGINLGILSEGLRWNATVTHVYFNDNDMTVNDCKALAHLLRVNFNIEYMDLSNNKLGDNGVGLLCDAISEQSEEEGIKVLILTNTGVTCEVGTCFNKVLNSSCILETLVLSSNDIETEGVIRMKEGALRSRTLRHLELRGANIDCEGVAHLAQVVYFNPDLERLDLRENPIKYPGLAALRDCLVLGAGPIEIELDDREKELQPLVEEIRKKSLGIGEDSFHCPPEERGEDFEEKVKLLLEKTRRRQREGDAYGMLHLAELVEQLKKELQEKKLGDSQSEEENKKNTAAQKKEEIDIQSSEDDKDVKKGSDDKCKPDKKPDKKDDFDDSGEGPQSKGPVQRTTGKEVAGSGATQDRSKDDKKDDDRGSDGHEYKDPVKEKTGREDKGLSEPKDRSMSDEKDDKDNFNVDDGWNGPESKGPVRDKSEKKGRDSDGTRDAWKPDKKSGKDKKDEDRGNEGPQTKGPAQRLTREEDGRSVRTRDGDRSDDEGQVGGPDGARGRGRAQQTTGGSLRTQGRNEKTSKEDRREKEDSDSQQGDDEPEQDGQKRQGSQIIRPHSGSEPEVERMEPSSVRAEAGSRAKSPAAKKPEGQRKQGTVKREVSSAAPERTRKSTAKPQAGDETTTVQGNEENRADFASHVSRVEVTMRKTGSDMEVTGRQVKQTTITITESYVCDEDLSVNVMETQGISKTSGRETSESQAKPKEQPENVTAKKEEARSQIVGGARPKERKELPKEEEKKKKKKRQRSTGYKRFGLATVEVDREFEDLEEVEVACLAMPCTDSEDDYDYTTRYGNVRTTYRETSPLYEEPKRKLRSPEPSPRTSPLPFATKERLKKARMTCAAKEAISEAKSHGMAWSHVMMLAESTRRETERVVDEEDEGESIYMDQAPRGPIEESDDEDLLGAVGGAPKLPPRMTKKTPPPPPPKSRVGSKTLKPRLEEPNSSEELPPPIPIPSKYAALGVRIPSCTRYCIRSWESILSGRKPLQPLDPQDDVPDLTEQHRRVLLREAQRKCLHQKEFTPEDIYRILVTEPVSTIYEHVLVPVMRVPNLTEDPITAERRTRIILRRGQEEELESIDNTEMAIALRYESEEDIPAPELHRNIAMMRRRLLGEGGPFYRGYRRNVQTEAETSFSAGKMLKAAFNKLTGNLLFKEPNQDERADEFWNLESDKRHDLLRREQMREASGRILRDDWDGPRRIHGQTQTDFADNTRKERKGKGSIWNLKSSLMKGKSKRKPSSCANEFIRVPWHDPAREYEEWLYYQQIKMFDEIRKEQRKKRKKKKPVIIKKKPWCERYAEIMRQREEEEVSEYQKEARKVLVKPELKKRVKFERNEVESEVVVEPEPKKRMEYETDERGKKGAVEPESEKWPELEPSDKGKVIVESEDDDNEEEKEEEEEVEEEEWLEYESNEKGKKEKKDENEEGETVNWYDWEVDPNQPSTSRGTGGLATDRTTRLGSRLQATINHMSSNAARNI